MSMPKIEDYKTVTITKNIRMIDFPLDMTPITTASNSQADVKAAMNLLSKWFRDMLKYDKINSYFNTKLDNEHFPVDYITPTELADFDDPPLKATIDAYLKRLLNEEADKNVQSFMRKYLSALRINHVFTFEDVTIVDNTKANIDLGISNVMSNFQNLLLNIEQFKKTVDNSTMKIRFDDITFQPDEIVLKYLSMRTKSIYTVYKDEFTLCKITTSMLGNKTLLAFPLVEAFHENFNIPYKSTNFSIGEHTFYLCDSENKPISNKINDMQLTMCLLFIKYIK